jgi:hypothetical protein
VYDPPRTFTILSGRWVGNTWCPAKSSTKGGHPNCRMGECRARGEMRETHKFFYGNLDQSEDFGVCRRMILRKMNLTEIGRKGVGWIGLAQNRERWLAFMNTVMNLRVP